MTARPLDRGLWPSFVLLIATFVLFEFTRIDLRLQDHFYDFAAKKWLVDAHEPTLRLLFYTGPKAAIFIFAGGLIGICLAPEIFRKRFIPPGVARRELIVVIATLITAPSLIAVGKATTNVFCPYEIHHYDGKFPYRPVCESYPATDLPAKRGRGFPAGHASGGFALLSLAGLGSSRRGRWIGASIGLGLGSLMGAYQMFKGAHFLSHTVVTAIICWIVFLIWRRVLHPGNSTVRAWWFPAVPPNSHRGAECHFRPADEPRPEA